MIVMISFDFIINILNMNYEIDLLMNSWNSDDLMQQVLITSKYEEID
jgi:hypothetical protein